MYKLCIMYMIFMYICMHARMYVCMPRVWALHACLYMCVYVCWYIISDVMHVYWNIRTHLFITVSNIVGKCERKLNPQFENLKGRVYLTDLEEDMYDKKEFVKGHLTSAHLTMWGELNFLIFLRTIINCAASSARTVSINGTLLT